MLDKCELRLYILAEAALLEEYRDDLEALVNKWRNRLKATS